MANLHDEVVEPYGYFTDILTAENGDEQRVQLRRHPRHGYEFSYLCPELTEGQHVSSVLYANRVKPWIVPLWCHARVLAESVGAGGIVVTVDTVNAPFRDPLGLGLYAVLWSGARSYEAVRIDTVGPTQLTLLAGTVQSWGQGAKVIPARVGYLVDEAVEQDWETGALVGGRVRFTFNAVDESLVAAPEAEGEIVFGALDEPPL